MKGGLWESRSSFSMCQHWNSIHFLPCDLNQLFTSLTYQIQSVDACVTVRNSSHEVMEVYHEYTSYDNCKSPFYGQKYCQLSFHQSYHLHWSLSLIFLQEKFIHYICFGMLFSPFPIILGFCSLHFQLSYYEISNVMGKMVDVD